MPRRTSKKRRSWTRLSDDRLLDLRLCELGLRMEGTWIEKATETLFGELDARGLLFRPHFWFSEEWFSPDGVPGIAIPFYLGHPRLLGLERKIMRDVEGGTRKEFLQILRHEAGHAADHAYRLHQRRAWQRRFGKSSAPYPDFYRPDPKSRRYVLHLEHWYAQAHPDEDFAETFAVWLTPGSQWRKGYAGWPALRKLRYVDETFGKLRDARPLVTIKKRVDPIARSRKTLRQYYSEKRERYAPAPAEHLDRDLRRIFEGPEEARGKGEPAAGFLRRHRAEIRARVAEGRGEYQFTLDQVLEEMITRCRELRLRAVGRRAGVLENFCMLLSDKTTLYLYRRRERVAL